MLWWSVRGLRLWMCRIWKTFPALLNAASYSSRSGPCADSGSIVLIHAMTASWPVRCDAPALAGDHLDGPPDRVQHPAELVVVGVAHADPRVGHEARFDGLRRRPGGREVAID